MEVANQSLPNLQSYRLPSNSIPLSYEIIIKSFIHALDFNFYGEVKIYVKIIQSTNEITLHARDIEIERITVHDENSIIHDLTHKLLQSHDFLIINLPRTYSPSEELILNITYNGELQADPSGFYHASYTDENGISNWYAATKFQINNARHAMPCYDEPGIRAPIRLTIMHGKNYSAISNMEVDEKLAFIDFCVTKFRQTPPMQTYLLAFVISNFECIYAENSKIPQRIFARPAAIVNGEAEFASMIVGPLLNAIEEHFGLEYPLPKLDHVGLSQFINGAMENFGIICYLERALLYNPTVDNEAKKMTIIRIVTHELIHQFFGNTVSPKWWNSTWMSEGLATLYEIYIANIVFPQYDFMSRFVTVNITLSFKDDVEEAWAMTYYTDRPDKLKHYFNRIGFEKSACVLRMFQEAMTPTTFAKGLNIYLRNSFMSVTAPSDLHAGLQAAYNQDFPNNKSLNIGKSMSTWENQPGYPIVSVRIYGIHLIISQKRHRASRNNEIYSIPLTIATKSNPDFSLKIPKVWLNTSSMSIANSSINFNENDWIILNSQQVGYYRVDNDTKLWHAIINQLIENLNLIHAINRAVLHDEIYLAWKEFGRVTAYECLDILSCLDKETEPISWNKAQVLMQTFYDRLFGTCVHKKFLEFLQKITNPHVDRHGFETVDGEASKIKSLRTSTKTWNCHVLGTKCLRHEKLKLKKYLNTEETSSIDFCAAMRDVDEETFHSLTHSVAMNSNFENRQNFLNNLGCSLNRRNLKKFLEISINSDNVLTGSERQTVIKSTMGRSVIGLNVTIDFIRDNYEAICKRLTSTSIYGILSTMTSYINTQLYIDKLETIMLKLFENELLNEENIAALRNSYLENIKWQIDNYDAVERWLMEKFKFSGYEKKEYMECMMGAKNGMCFMPKKKRMRRLAEV